MSRLLIVIPGNPGDGSINAARRAIVVGKHRSRATTIKSTRARTFEQRATLSARSAASANPVAAAACAAAPTLGATITAYWPRGRKLAEGLALGDVDAPIKATLDAIELAGIVDDDVRFIEVIARKVHDKDNPRIEVEVYALDVGSAARAG